MNFNNIVITKREVMICIAITIILTTLGFLISTKIENCVNEKNEKYFKSLKIDNDEEMFKYSIMTNVGYVLAEGNINSINPVSIDDIDGDYFYIKKVKEKYTIHTRKVKHTRTVGNRIETYYTTEEYWTWDYVGEEEKHIDKFTFLGEEFYYEDINFNNSKYKETKTGGYHIRYQYYVIESEFQGCLFSKIIDNKTIENKFYHNTSIQDIINSKQKELDSSKIVFWVLWIIFILIIDFVYVSLENRYLEDK